MAKDSYTFLSHISNTYFGGPSIHIRLLVELCIP